MKFADRSIYHHTIKTPYANDSKEQLLLRFRSENWPHDPDQRILIIQELENRCAKEQNRPACVVKAEKTELGSYYKGIRKPALRREDDGRIIEETRKNFRENRNVLRVNVTDHEGVRDVNNSYEMLDSCFHEGRHSQQSFAKKELNTDTSKMCDVEIPEGTRYYNYNYQTCAGDLPNSKVLSYNNHYDMMTCEMDANSHACNRMLDLKDLYKDDPKYAEYLDRRLSHFKSVNELNDTHKYSRILRQHDMVDNALERGDITVKEAKVVREKLDNRVLYNEKEPIVEDSIACENRIKNTLKEMNYQSTQNRDIGILSQYNGYDLENIPESDMEGIKNYESRNISRSSDSLKAIQAAGIKQRNKEIDAENREFFSVAAKRGGSVKLEEDSEFFKNNEQQFNTESEMKADKSFFEKIGEKSDELAQKADEKLEEGMQTAARVASMTKGQKQ